jgi:hypothetical protein
MAHATQFLRGQLDAYAESWKADHLDAMECWDLEGRIDVGLALFHFVRSADEHWSEGVRAGTSQSNGPEFDDIENLYKRWLETADDVLASARRMELEGFSVAGLNDFRNACREARSALAADVNSLRASFAELDAGKGRPLFLTSA